MHEVNCGKCENQEGIVASYLGTITYRQKLCCDDFNCRYRFLYDSNVNSGDGIIYYACPCGHTWTDQE